MNMPVITDVFKFLAVRPAQRVTEKETAQTMIRDKRAATPAGAREIAVLARQLSVADTVLAHWNQLDLPALGFLADGYRELLRSYESLKPDDNVPLAKTLLKDAGLTAVKDGTDPKLTNLAWEALYTAHATGRHAGERLETPLAALRVLHFAQIDGAGVQPAVNRVGGPFWPNDRQVTPVRRLFRHEGLAKCFVTQGNRGRRGQQRPRASS